MSDKPCFECGQPSTRAAWDGRYSVPCCDSEECRADIEGKAPGALAAQVDAAAAGWSEHGQSRAERIERAALDLVRAIGFLPYASAGLDEDIVSMVVEAEEALREALEKNR